MRIWKVLLLGLVLLGLVASVSQAEVRNLTLSSAKNELTLIERQGDALHYRAQIGTLSAINVMTREGLFTRLLIPGFHTSHVEGAPELPMMNRMIEIPSGGRARIEVISSQSRSYTLADLGIDNRLMPAQPSMPKNAEPATWPFVYDDRAYASPRVALELVRVVGVGQLRSVELGRLEVSPVSYFPAERRIEVQESVEFRVIFDGGDSAAEADLKDRTASPFFDPVYGRVEGYRDLHDNNPDRVRDVVTMVVITPPQFAAQLQTFVNWKIRRGFNTILAVTGSPPVGSTKEEIKAYITGLYNNGTAQQPAPSFVLFVGDVEQLPTWMINGDATDRPYCDIVGDQVPDIYYGRFSATNPAQLQAMLDKTLMYDQFTMPDPSYLNEVVMIGGMDSNYGQVWANGQINYGTTYYFNEIHDILSHTYLYPNSGSQETAIIANLNNGVAYANYTAHGSETSWSDPSLTQANVNALTNTGKYFLGVGNCCLTSTYDYPECLGETMIRAANKAAIGYIGGSNSTYWDEDYWWGVGYTSNIVEHPTYETTATGAYDGLFHDRPNEADMGQWYVTNDAIIFCGNLAVMESGSSRIAYYWNIYNLLGDPSLSTYLGAPGWNNVVHPTTVFTNWSSINVQAAAGSYVGLTKDGVLIGAGTVDATGNLVLPIWAEPLTPGTAHIVVMAQNRQPYQADINVLVPATVIIDPSTIDANVTTAIDVGVYEFDGVTPKPGVDVWATGLNYESAHAMTGADGHCTLSVTYPYGPTLDIIGKYPSDPYVLFTRAISVRAQLLTQPDLWVTTDIGMQNMFALNLPGVLHAQVGQPGHTLFAFLNGSPVGNTTDTSLQITPAETGEVEGIIAVSGYNLYRESFAVVEAYGTLTGHVTAGGAPAIGAVVTGYDGADQEVFQATTNAQGDYNVGEDILCAAYTIKADLFGYLHWEQTFFVNYGPNVLNIALDAAPSGILSGFITETGTGIPLEATVKVYRMDNGQLYTQTTSSPVDGSFATASLPYFDYRVVVKAYRHIPVTMTMTIDEPNENVLIALDPTIGDILLIDDSAKSGTNPEKVDEKSGLVLGDGYVSDDGKAAVDLENDLTDLGYTVTVETMPASDPADWPNYDMIISSSGNKTDPLANATFRANLIAYVQSGGHLLLEGGEVGYDHYGDSAFGTTVMHSTDWNADQSGNVTIATPTHPVVSVPNVIPGPIAMTYSGYGDEDAMAVRPDAVKVCSWSSYANDASIIAYDPNPAPEGGQIVFYCFNYSAMDASVRPLLLQNTVVYLMTPEIGNCSISGSVTLLGQTDHSGVKVEATPNGGFVMTAPDGSYSLNGLFAGSYTVRASKDGWSTGVEQESLSDGQQMTGCDFILTPLYTYQACRQPHLSIPDNNQTGVTDPMGVMIPGGPTVSEVEVYVNITHTYIGDLTVKLTSPDNTTVILHNRTGGTTENIVGWYPGDITPNQSLDAFIGKLANGVWRLTVIDQAGSDVGTLNEWCLRIKYGADVADAENDTKPLALALEPARPNPAAPVTAIRFDLPSASTIDLAVFDVTGRRVVTLAAGLAVAGRHEAVWEGRDDQRRAVATGQYFIRLTVDGRSLTRKLLLVR
jgi:subtilisin-like proprotein convertase family protein